MWANEIDRYCADWLRNLLPGITVDERSIVELGATDVFDERSHFFAGVGGWEYALQLAEWPQERPVWTGSCPCQPFSSAGERRTADDVRHLWPQWRWLIAELRPPTIFGEQVASDLGREWLARVRADLELLGYAVGCADLCAAGVAAPHVRQRLFWVGNTASTRCEGSPERCERPQEGLALPSARRAWDVSRQIPSGDNKTRRIEPGLEPLAHGVPGRVGRLRAYGNAIVPQVAAAFIRAFLESEHAN